MLTEWPAPTGEVELLEQVHRRARVLTTRRVVGRTVPLTLAAVVVSASLFIGNDGRPAPLRVAGEGVAPMEALQVEEREEGAAPAGSPESDEPAQAPGPRIGTRRPAPDRVAAGNPESPVYRSNDEPPITGPHLVDDPEGDERYIENDGIDLRYGDLAYLEAADSLRATIGVTNLAAAMPMVNHAFGFEYEAEFYDLEARRSQDGTTVVNLAGRECRPCSVVYDVQRSEVRIDVPLTYLNERIAAVSTSYGRSVYRNPPPPVAKGSTFRKARMLALTEEGGPAVPPQDSAMGDKPWTVQ